MAGMDQEQLHLVDAEQLGAYTAVAGSTPLHAEVVAASDLVAMLGASLLRLTPAASTGSGRSKARPTRTTRTSRCPLLAPLPPCLRRAAGPPSGATIRCLHPPRRG